MANCVHQLVARAAHIDVERGALVLPTSDALLQPNVRGLDINNAPVLAPRGLELSVLAGASILDVARCSPGILTTGSGESLIRMAEPVSEAQTSFVINSLDGYMQTNRRSVFVGESTQVRIVSADGLLLLPATDSFSVEPAGRIEISRSTELDGRYQLTGVTEGRATVWRRSLSVASIFPRME